MFKLVKVNSHNDFKCTINQCERNITFSWEQTLIVIAWLLVAKHLKQFEGVVQTIAWSRAVTKQWTTDSGVARGLGQGGDKN